MHLPSPLESDLVTDLVGYLYNRWASYKKLCSTAAPSG